MKLVGYNLNKIKAEKKDMLRPKELKINTNMEVEQIKEVKSDAFKTKEEMILCSFAYKITYEPDFAEIEFKGNLVISLDPKAAKAAVHDWKKKKMSEDLRIAIFNVILSKSNIKALQLEEEFNLPHHVPMPSLKPQKE